MTDRERIAELESLLATVKRENTDEWMMHVRSVLSSAQQRVEYNTFHGCFEFDPPLSLLGSQHD